MATKKCKLMSVCVLILHSISLCVVSSHVFSQHAPGAFDVDSPILSNIRHIRHRLKRATTTITVEKSIPENTSNPIFNVRNELTNSNANSRLFVLADSSIRNLFDVDFNGNVNIAANKSLDYEDVSMREINLKINATSRTDQTDVVILDITIRLSGVNDESPVFKNSPSPFWATVPPNANTGVKVYELYAEDPDGSDVVYTLQAGSEGRFRVETKTIFSTVLNRNIIVGDILVQGSGAFLKDEYHLVIQAGDTAQKFQSTTAEVWVKVGVRPPQFYERYYFGKIPEQSSANQYLEGQLKVQAKSFQKRNIRYDLYQGNANESILSPLFTIDSNTGIIKTASTLTTTDLDFERVPKEQRPVKYALSVKATELNTELSSTVDLTVELTDNNDNSPIFEYSSYQAREPENVALKTTIITVKATDDDSGTNAEIVYSVTDGNFTVETVNDPVHGYIGYIQVKVELDYDRIVGHTYSFTVMATDKGSPPLTGTADIYVIVSNVNDEAPELQIDNSTILSVREDAAVDYVVTFLQATDLDGDQVHFYFSPPENTQSEIFTIVPESGLIRLNSKVPKNKDMYVLNITVKDDGSCCGGSPQLSTQAHLFVEIVDVNEHKPSFPNCTEYNSAMILEHQPRDTSIITVKAVDDDRNENGRVAYNIKFNPVPILFNVDLNSGLVTSARSFDREETQSYSITVRGIDHAKPALEGYCTFRINIGDVNDNKPIFDQPSYTANILQNVEAGRSVANVRAEDRDIGLNAAIDYFLITNPDEMFNIDKEAGILYLNKTLGVINQYNLVVMAKDRGVPPLNSTVPVVIKVAGINVRPPTWNKPDYDAKIFYVNETASIGYQIAEFSATSNIDSNPDVLFYLINKDGDAGNIVEPFYIETSGQTVKLKVQSPLDYKVKASYELLLRVINYNSNPLKSEIKPRIQLKDRNNKVPYFVGVEDMYPGSVTENSAAQQTVIDVKAFDDDADSPNNDLTFSILYKNGTSNLFSIHKVDSNTARITTNHVFDREVTSIYFMEVQVEDGIASDIPNHLPAGTPNSGKATVRIAVTDQNDNSPYFENATYTGSIKEDAALGTSVIMVTGLDPDSADVLTYSITSGNLRNAFGVQTKKGIIVVARQLDYEKDDEKVFTLTLMVSDGLHTNTTTVIINVIDVNDNRPRFDLETYTITDVVEEDATISPSSPRELVRVVATDADKSRPNNITYSVLGLEHLFTINPTTGVLYLIQPLDRDEPDGSAIFQFNVRAMDEPQNPDTAQFGFASVEVKPIDINDNKPTFTEGLNGRVDEHSANGSPVMTVIARDPDYGINGSVVYFIDQGPVTRDSIIRFAINNDGLITTNCPPDDLDREKVGEFYVKVTAHDQGLNPETSTATVTITLNDINDQVPHFSQKFYNVTMSEFQESEEIALVRATDNDIGENARLRYSLAQSDKEYFSITSINNDGIIMVYQPVDYEQPEQRRFNLTVTVRDNNPDHKDVAYVRVTVEDFNDNAPIFQEKTIYRSVLENVTIGTELATFAADDPDSGINALFTFHIDAKSNKRRQFAIDPMSGVVTVQRGLDRETQDSHDVIIQAIDKGDPQQTGTANLVVTLLDVNDNYPIFKEDYHPIIMENDANFPKELIRVHGKDLDTPVFGPPFLFASTRCSDGTLSCPCEGRPTCRHFNLTANNAGDNGNGEGIVMTLTQFDREVKKYYYMPIVMSDMRGKGDPSSQTGTNTLTIEIGDVNDNKHGPGHKDIFAYDYKGFLENFAIGNVYATDPDDWDVVDKTFTYVGPEYLAKFFKIDKDNGSITILKNVPVDKEYTFRVSVYDNVWATSAESTVTVTIKDLTEEAVRKSGSMRLTGITAEQFMEREKIPNGDLTAYEDSKSDKFRSLMANKIQSPVGNIEVISVMNNGQFTDVRFSAHGSPYYDSSKTEAVLSLNKKEFEDQIGINIAMVPIDECRDEKFEDGCYNHLSITGKPALVNTNGTSFVGVETKVLALAVCRAQIFPDPEECTADYCYNGGECVKDDWGRLSCPNCPIGSDGPRCQETHHSFDGKSYAMYKPLEQCKDGQTSFEFITTNPDGLLLYNGPITNLEDDDPQDYISVELINGYPKLRIDHGTGELTLQIDGRNQHGLVTLQKLDNGKWHHLDIIREGNHVELIVDRCEVALIENEIISDDNACRKSDNTPSENMFLNVNTLLQLGGRAENPPPNYPVGITSTRFNGCLKNLFHNGLMYNLHIGGTPGYPSGENGCRREEDICGANSISGPVCGDNGICVSTWQPKDYTCRCKPGFRGAKCTQETTIKDLKTDSYLKWQLSDNLFNEITPRKLHMQLMFRTRDAGGVLMTVSTADTKKHVTIEISSGILQVRYNLGTSESERLLQLYNSPVDDGRWHLVELERYGKQFVLKLDGGEGRNYNYTVGKPGESEEINIHRVIYTGASVFVSSSVALVSSDLSDTCINDIRMEHDWFPMDMNQNDQSTAAVVLRAVNLEDQCTRNDCDGVVCKEGRVCYPLWGEYECRCPEGFKDVEGVCVKVNFCDEDPCVGGICITADDKCKCDPGWIGELCNRRHPGTITAGLSTSAIVAIVVSIFIALILALVVIFLVKFSERPKDGDKYILEVDPDEDIRENVMNYDEEGAGEEDHDAYDISRLRKPDDTMSFGKSPLDTIPRTRMPGLGRAPRSGDPDVGGFIDDRLGDADDDPNAPPGDNVCEYAYEGGGSDAGSLSSLNTTSSDGDQDYDYLNDWGPKFARLADMYGAGLDE